MTDPVPWIERPEPSPALGSVQDAYDRRVNHRLRARSSMVRAADS